MDEIQKLIEDHSTMKFDEKFVASGFFPKVFHNLYHNLVDQLRLLTLMDEFADAVTNEERMKISSETYKLLGDDNYIENRYKEVKDKINFKDKDMSNKLRDEGNKAYRKGDHWTALDLYTKSIANAPEQSVELARAYANRSGVLKSLRRYRECLVDIKRAVNHGYPADEKSFKLLLRQAQCRRNLGNKEQASISFKRAIYLLQNHSGLPEKEIEGWMEEIELEEILSPQDDSCSEQVIFPDEVPELTYGPSDEVPCASSAVRIAYDDQQGRHLVATRDIKIGDILLIGENTFGTVFDEHKFDHCAHCHKLCYNLLPCSNCCWVMFCSKQCQENADTKYHSVECAAYSRFYHLNGRLAHGVLMDRVIRLVATIGISNLKPFFKYAKMDTKEEENMSNEAKRTKGFNDQGIFDPSDINTVFNLFSKIDCREFRRCLLLTSLFTLQIPRCFGLPMDSNSDFFPIAGLCLQLECTALMSSIAETHANFQHSPMSKTTSVGCFNSLSALLNHSCISNTCGITCGNKNITIAKWPIPKGSVLTESYIHFDVTCSKEQRQRMLRTKFLFDCKCDLCENDWRYRQIISDPKDQELVDQLSSCIEPSLLEMHRTLPAAKIKEEFMQVRFDFLTRMWQKKQYYDYRCHLIEGHLYMMYLLQGNRIMPPDRTTNA